MEDNMADPSRPQMFLFGCTLTSAKREHKVEVDEDDETEQQLSLKAVCLGADAEDKFHMVEVEGLTFDGKTTRVPLTALKPSVLPSVALGGFEITPPVTFRLQSGSGPVYISGQHFVGVKESEDGDEEENNSSPVKRPAGLSGKKPHSKKLKMDSDEDDSDEEDEDDDDADDDDSDENEVKLPKPSKPDFKKEQQVSGKKLNKSPEKTGKSGSKPKSPASGKDRAQAGSKSPSVAEIKSKLSAAVKEGKPLPKTEQKLENYVKYTYKVTDKNVVKELWNHVQTLKTASK
ncbi:nucleophosmin 1b [Eucyclogobius newberryi]|uniref:nucleophosmin 1b n=1 Tax=Eucyclogobius newberryi TaxID=166745 RepID=UPI003B597069